MKKLPGDTLFLKLAETINPKTLLAQKGLDLLQEQMPDPVAQQLQETRELPGNIKQSLTTYLNQLLGKEEAPKEDTPIEKSEDLASAMTSLSDRAKKFKSESNGSQRPKSNHSTDFYMDEMYLPYGPSFSLVPPYIQI